MKKTLRILSLVLVVVLACSITLTACADSCYQLLKASFNDTDSPLYISKGTPRSYGLDSNMTMAWYDMSSNQIVVVTKGESIVFNNVDFATGVYSIYCLCGVWDSLESQLGYGYTLGLGVVNGSDSDSNIWIGTALEATAFRNAVEGLVNDN